MLYAIVFVLWGGRRGGAEGTVWYGSSAHETTQLMRQCITQSRHTPANSNTVTACKFNQNLCNIHWIHYTCCLQASVLWIECVLWGLGGGLRVGCSWCMPALNLDWVSCHLMCWDWELASTLPSIPPTPVPHRHTQQHTHSHTSSQSRSLPATCILCIQCILYKF